MMKKCWVPISPDRCGKVLGAALLLPVLCAAAASETSLTEFSLGMKSYADKDYGQAISHLERAQKGIPELQDYVAYYIASARAESGDFASVPKALGSLHQFKGMLSPLTAKATLLEAQAFLAVKSPKDTVRILKEEGSSLAQPDADYTLAQAYEAVGEPAQAAVTYQRVYFGYPATAAAAQSALALSRLKESLGPGYPPPMPTQMFERGEQWLEAKEYAKARELFEALAPQLGGEDRDRAHVRIGQTDYLQGKYSIASDYLKTLKMPRSDADAERLYYIEECARKMSRDEEMLGTVKQLGRDYAQSPWRLKALLSAGNRFLLLHQPAQYLALFREAYERFPADADTAYCHWKAAFAAYLGRQSQAGELMREHTAKYPFDTKTAGALYFLARLAENASEWDVARAYYDKVVSQFPHYYYAAISAQRLTNAKVAAATPNAKITEWLNQISFPDRPDLRAQQPNVATRMRIERARLLAAAGFPDWATFELRFGAQTDGQPHLLAMALARTELLPHKGLRNMKSLAPEYLSVDFERAPTEFWHYLFPLPFETSLTKSAREQNIDPYLLAGLIRQESEFNPGAVSRANALGLTQLILSTAKMMARQNGMRSVTRNMLFEPETNLKLGASYLRTQLSHWNGSVEQTLAAYNAGPGRVREWLTMADYREPAEFVENIPFTETREYVQAVMRNAVVYRQLYDARGISKTASKTPADALTSSHGNVPRQNASARKPRPVAKRKRARTLS